MNEEPLYVTQSSLPPLEELTAYMEKIWTRKMLTNGGVCHQELEQKLCEYLGVPHICLFSSGTAALLAALKVLDVKGEVITTPFSFVATSNALLWCNLTPVFVDVDPHTANIDPAKIEASITPQTTAIMAVHCYGQSCDVKAIEAIAKKHNLKVIYDAAHAFGVEDERGSILNAGDMAALSFHATKVFNTAEGGALVCHSAEMKARIDRYKNFGFTSESDIECAGFNGKMSEINAAMGLVQLNYIDEYINKRSEADQYYRAQLENVAGIECLSFENLKRYNYAYFPVRVMDEYSRSRDELFEHLKQQQIFTRRYFYPSITDMTPYKMIAADVPVSNRLADQILCLPMFSDIKIDDMKRVIEAIKE